MTGVFVGDTAQGSVETRPALRFDLLVKASLDFLFATWSKFERDPL
jgi:hypothetical protein